MHIHAYACMHDGWMDRWMDGVMDISVDNIIAVIMGVPRVQV